MGLFKKKKKPQQTLQQILDTPLYPTPEPIIPYEFQANPEPYNTAAVTELANNIKAAVAEYQATLPEPEDKLDDEPYEKVYFPATYQIFDEPPEQTDKEKPPNKDRVHNFLNRTAQIPCQIAKVIHAANISTYHIRLNNPMDLKNVKQAVDAMAADFEADIIRKQSRGYGAHFAIAVPRQKRQTVYLKDLLRSSEFCDVYIKPNSLPAVIGTDDENNPVCIDIAKLPHLLCCGTTGSGKSVAINSILISALSERTPKQLQLVLIDPKEVESIAYAGLPHLLFPVVTDMNKAKETLKKCVKIMEQRQKKATELGVRELGEETPHILIVIDEMADLMMTHGRQVEELIVRICQKARAFKMHIICATQSPVAKVVTNLIRANLPARLAFKTSSDVESRIAKGTNGCRELLGKGDGLFIHGDEIRIQAAWNTTAEIEALKRHYGIVEIKEPRKLTCKEEYMLAKLEFYEQQKADGYNYDTEKEKEYRQILSERGLLQE